MTPAAVQAWAGAPVRLRLEADDVHVWLVDVSSSTPERLLRTLSSDERARADRFHFDRDRREFAHCRGMLRHLLAAYLDVDPRALIFHARPHGKPILMQPEGDSLAFNVSHSGGLALIAVSRRGEIGVDIEAHRALADRDDLADRFFSRGEAARLRSLSEPSRAEAFFTCWSRKEAYVKAVGDGLGYPLEAFDVTFASGEAPRIDIPHDPAEARRWVLEAVPVPDGYAAALVTEGRRVVNWRAWSDVPDVRYQRRKDV